MANSTQQKNWYLEQFKVFEKSLNGQRSLPIHELRKEALKQFAELEFPSLKNEDWKYTNIEPIINLNFESDTEAPALSSKDIEAFKIEDMAAQLVFVNGQYVPALSRIDSNIKGVAIKNLSAVLSENNERITAHIRSQLKNNTDIFSALNSSFIMDGLYIEVPDHAEVTQPIYLLYLTSSGKKHILHQPYNFISVGRNARVSLVENYASLDNGRAFTNGLTAISQSQDSEIQYVKIQQENTNTYHIGTTDITQERGCRITHRVITSGGALVRNMIRLNLNGEGIESTLDGVCITKGTQHVDNRTVIHHAKPNCATHELYKGILDGKSTGVFNGKIIVHPDAQKTDAKQSNKNLLLSPDATMNTKPQLEIFADDVKCTHGATIGKLEDESLFYLRTRGIGKEQAKNMLTYAFAGEIVERIQHEATREYLDNLLLSLLEH